MSDDQQHHAATRARTAIEILSAVYILCHLLPWIFGWLALPWAVGLSLIIVLAWVRATRTIRIANTSADHEILAFFASRRGLTRLTVILLIAMAAVAASGVGGLTFQLSDYSKHDMVVRELSEFSWPLGYVDVGPDKVTGPLAYYFGYYMPLGLIISFFGWSLGHLLSILWVALGLTLTAVWLLLFLRTANLAFVLLLFLFGGLDLVAQALFSDMPGATPIHRLVFWVTHDEWWLLGRGWLDFWQLHFATVNSELMPRPSVYWLMSPLTRLSFGPQHLVPVWIIILMILHDAQRSRALVRIPFLWSMLPMCSLFAAMGMVPFVILTLLQIKWRDLFSFANTIVGPLWLIVQFLYFDSIVGDVRTGWIWEFQEMGSTWPLLLGTYVLEIGIFALFFWRAQPHPTQLDRAWFGLALLSFLLAPIYCMGEINDFSNNVVGPALLLLIVGLSTALRAPNQRGDRIRARILTALLIFGCLGSLGIFARAWDYGMGRFHPRESVRHGNELIPSYLSAQAIADGDHIFWRWLAPPMEFQFPDPPEVVAEWDFTSGNISEEVWEFVPSEATPTDDGVLLTLDSPGLLTIHPTLEIGAAEVGTVILDVVPLHWPEGAAPPTFIIHWSNDPSRPAGAPHRVEIVEHPMTVHETYANSWWYQVGKEPYWRETIRSLAISVTFDPSTGPREFLIERIIFLQR